MKKLLKVGCLLLCIVSLTGCGEEEKLIYGELPPGHIDELLAESYEGVSATAAATPEIITVDLHNNLEHDIELIGWGPPCVLRDGVWYVISDANPVTTNGLGEAETPEKKAARTVSPRESKEFTLEFSATYSGATLAAGEYCIYVWFEIPELPTRNDPDRAEQGSVWTEFTVEEK